MREICKWNGKMNSNLDFNPTFIRNRYTQKLDIAVTDIDPSKILNLINCFSIFPIEEIQR